MKLILGSVQFGTKYGINNKSGKPSDKSIKSILDMAVSKGIKLIDTAEAYGDSQIRIGEYHRNFGNKFKIITKFSSSVKHLPFSILERVKNNIRILQVDNLYCYMFHSYNDFNEHFKNFERDLVYLKNQGLIGKLGVSVYSNEEIKKILEFDNVDLIQLPYNLLDNSRKRDNILKKAKKKGIEIHTRSAFLQGLFFKHLEELQNSFNEAKPYLSLIKQKAFENNISIGKMALNYCLSNRNIDNVIVGVDSIEQLIENLNWSQNSISSDLINYINNINFKNEKLLNPSNW